MPFVVDIDRDRLEQGIKNYFDPAISSSEMKQIAPVAMEDAARFDARTVRATLQKRGYRPQNIGRYCYRPFDTRWLYWEPETKLLDEKRPDYFQQVFGGNIFLAAVQQNRKEFDPPLVATSLCSLHVIERGANLFPMLTRPVGQRSLLDENDSDSPRPNLSPAAADYLEIIGASDTPECLFYHALAILHAPRYRVENTGALRQDWPRIPLPETYDALKVSAALGKQIAALLDTETPVSGVTSAHGVLPLSSRWKKNSMPTIRLSAQQPIDGRMNIQSRLSPKTREANPLTRRRCIHAARDEDQECSRNTIRVLLLPVRLRQTVPSVRRHPKEPFR